jgi:hypothetical protein
MSGSVWPLCLAAVLGLSGCAEKSDLTAPDDGMRSVVRQARTQKGDIECQGISSKAHQIETDLGANPPSW